MEQRVTIRPKKATSRTSKLDVRVNTVEWERFEKLKDEYGFSTESAAARYFVNIGMRAIVETDPRNNRTTAQDQDSVPKVRDYVPEGEENAIDLRNELGEVIAENMYEIVEADNKMKRDGFKVWRDG